MFLTCGHQKYIIGTDTYDTIQSDGIYYAEFNQHRSAQQCTACGSYRMVNLYWYKRILAKTMKTLPSTKNIENESHFLGCLHCQAQYEKFDPAKNNKYGYLQAIGYLLFFWLIVTKFNDFLGWVLNNESMVSLGLFKYLIAFIAVFISVLMFIWLGNTTHIGMAQIKRIDN